MYFVHSQSKVINRPIDNEQCSGLFDFEPLSSSRASQPVAEEALPLRGSLCDD